MCISLIPALQESQILHISQEDTITSAHAVYLCQHWRLFLPIMFRKNKRKKRRAAARQDSLSTGNDGASYTTVRRYGLQNTACVWGVCFVLYRLTYSSIHSLNAFLSICLCAIDPGYLHPIRIDYTFHIQSFYSNQPF